VKSSKIIKGIKKVMNNITEYYPFYFLFSFRKEILIIRKLKEEINSTRIDLNYEIRFIKEIRDALLNVQIFIPKSEEEQVKEIIEEFEKKLKKRSRVL